MNDLRECQALVADTLSCVTSTVGKQKSSAPIMRAFRVIHTKVVCEQRRAVSCMADCYCGTCWCTVGLLH